MNNPVIFTVTTAGKNAALDAARRGLSVSLTRLTLGTGKWSATKSATQLRSPSLNFTLVSGDVEAASSTLRFSVTMSSNTVFDAYEIGLFTSTGVLFAIATHATHPLVRLHPDVSIVVGSFGLHLGDLDASSITVVSDPSSPIAVQMYQQHLAAADPHPQYLTDQAFNTAHEEILRRLRALESKEIIPVGGLFITSQHYATGEDVARALGYGRWARFSKGTTLVGHDPDATTGDGQPWWSTLGNIVGEFEHQLTIAEMPKHRHQISDIAGTSSGGSGIDHNGGRGNHVDTDMSFAGGDKPHNNVQPSVVVAIWVRLPNSGSLNMPQLYEGVDASRYQTAVVTSDLRRVDEALAKVDELERRLAELQSYGSQTDYTWAAMVSISSYDMTDHGQDRPVSASRLHDPVFYQTAGAIKDISMTHNHIQQMSATGLGSNVTGITLTFNDETDINRIMIIPKPVGLKTSDKRLYWETSSSATWQLRETL